MVHNGTPSAAADRGNTMAAIGMTKNHAFRVLKTLEERGFVRRVDDR